MCKFYLAPIGDNIANTNLHHYFFLPKLNGAASMIHYFNIIEQ
jgi:hypothetical protein